MFLRAWFIIFAVVVMFIPNQAFADQDSRTHGHKPVHGGLIQEADETHAEFRIDKFGRPKLYLYDKAMKPVERSDIQATLTVKTHQGAQHQRDLKFTKDSKEGSVFTGETINGLKDWDTAVVSLKLKDSWTHLRFSHH
jgi:hypothetical protein